MDKKEYKCPSVAADIIIVHRDKIVLIKRKNPPYGWALPGGFVDYGESLEDAAVREAKEETSLDVKLIRQLKTYSKPGRDPRQHVISTVFVAEAANYQKAIAADDAESLQLFAIYELPNKLAFDHEEILKDFVELINLDE